MLHITSCCALLAQADIHVPAGMQCVQHYRRDMLMFVAMRKIHFDHISDIKILIKGNFWLHKKDFVIVRHGLHSGEVRSLNAFCHTLRRNRKLSRVHATCDISKMKLQRRWGRTNPQFKGP